MLEKHASLAEKTDIEKRKKRAEEEARPSLRRLLILVAVGYAAAKTSHNELGASSGMVAARTSGLLPSRRGVAQGGCAQEAGREGQGQGRRLGRCGGGLFGRRGA